MDNTGMDGSGVDDSSRGSVQSMRSTSTVHSSYIERNDIEVQGAPAFLASEAQTRDLYQGTLDDFGDCSEREREDSLGGLPNFSFAMSEANDVPSKHGNATEQESGNESFGFVTSLSRLDLDDVILGDGLIMGPTGGMHGSERASARSLDSLVDKDSEKKRQWQDRAIGTGLTLLMALSLLALTYVSFPYFLLMLGKTGSSSTSDVDTTEPHTQSTAPRSRIELNRMDSIRQRIIESGISSVEDLYDEESVRLHALRWLSMVDDYVVDVDDPELLDRYALAVFYYSSRTDISKAHSLGQWHLNGKSVKWKNWMMDLSICHWRGLFCENEALVEFNVSSTNIKGTIPPEFRTLSNLKMMDLSFNQLEGTIPDFVVDIDGVYHGMSSLEYLHLTHNELTGTFPNSITHMRSLLNIKLNDNFLTGTLPEDWDLMMHLQKLEVGRNQLEGTLPQTIQTMITLVDLQVQQNQFHGPLPDLDFSVYLRTLYLFNNRFTGALPISWIEMANLEDIIITHNEVTGTIPTQYGSHLVQLKRFAASHNYLEGSIPTEVGHLANLQHLLLDHNQLTGTVPTELGDCEGLWSVHLHSNDLMGVVGDEICNMTLSEIDGEGLQYLSTDCTTGAVMCSCCKDCF